MTLILGVSLLEDCTGWTPPAPLVCLPKGGKDCAVLSAGRVPERWLGRGEEREGAMKIKRAEVNVGDLGTFGFGVEGGG